MTYFAQRKSIKAGTVTENHRFGERAEMLRQYFLYCASAATNEGGNDFDSAEFGTVEHGVKKREEFIYETAETAPEEGGDSE